MSSPNHHTSNIKDAFSFNFRDYILASSDYVPASLGKTYSRSSNNSFGLVLIASPTLLLFHDFPYMKVMHAYYAKESPIPPPVIMPQSPMLSPMFNPQEFFLPEELLPPKKHGHSEGAVGLIRWFERTELVFSCNNYTEDCKVKFAAGLHHGSATSPYLFTLIMDKLLWRIPESILWCMIFADDIVLIAELAEGLNNKIERWWEALKDNGLWVSREKTKYLICDFDRVTIRPAMLYGSECWPITKAQANRVEVMELRMLRLRWFRHVRRRPQSAFVKRVEAMLVEGSRRKGRPKLRWEDRLKQGMKEFLLSEDITSDRNA
uniref:Reverse transcriptase domain-containing protein n=1 Tax=Tanacetum cinerariifolium TaxID=118510 RepID=A0A699H4Q8_TANCI|nr:hypothetical protein [Tanacetum cinerariifolium]